MLKPTRSRLRAAVFAGAAAIGLGAWAAPSATAVWRSNLGASYTIGGNTYAIAPGGGTLRQDGTIQAPGISEWAAGSTIDLSAVKPSSVSVLVKYSGFTAPAPADWSTTYPSAIAGVQDSDGNLIGEIVGNTSDSKAQPYYMSKAEVDKNPGTSTPVSSTGATIPASGYFLFSYSAASGNRFYTGETIDALDGYQDTTAHWSGKTVATLSIGGEALKKTYNGAGFVIEEVALFVNQYLTADAVADYVFPTLDGATALAMSGLNTQVAAGSNVFFTGSPVVTLDDEPSDGTKTYLQSAGWNGTVLIKDVDKTDIVPTAYGNPNSTLKFSGVKGYFAAAKYNSSATPMFELEDSTTTDREYALYMDNGYSFESNGSYYWTQTPELKGSGTLKADTSGAAVLIVVDKWDDFTGKLDLTNKAVYFGTGIPQQAKNVVSGATVKVNGALPSTIGTWTVGTRFAGSTVTLLTAANAAETAFLTDSSKWNGTCQLNWNHSSAFDIVNYGNADSVIEVVSAFSAYPTQNGGAAAANLAAELKLSADWTVGNGWDNKTTTFAKLSGTGNLIVNGTTSNDTAIPYTITKIENFTGALGGARGKFTIGTIVAATEPVAGTKLVSLSSLTKEPVLTGTVVEYNGAVVDDIKLEVKSDGIYVAEPYVAQIYGGDKYTSLQAAVDAATRNSKIIVLANETDGATIPSTDSLAFYIYTGGFTTGEILDATGDYITTRTTEEISISDDIHADKVSATKYSVSAAFMAVTIDGTRTLYGQANANDALTAANAGSIGTTIEFLSGDPASYAEYLPMFDYNSETGVYTKVTNPVAAVYSGVQQLSVHRTLADAVEAAANGQTVKLLDDVTLADKLVVSNKTVTIDADSAKTITGQMRIVDGSNVTIGQNITLTSDKHPTIFVLGDVSVSPKVVGTAKSTLVVNGTVLNTNAGFDQTFTIAGNGLDTQGVDITINGTVRNANGIAIYQAFPGNLVINGTVEGASAISIKDGTLTVNSGAIVAATLASGAAYVGNNNGESPTGDAIIAPYYPAGTGYGTPVVTIAGGTVTVTDTENCSGIEAYDFDGVTAPDDAATNVGVSGGTFNTAVADEYCADGYEPADLGNGTYGVRVDKGWIYEDADFPGYTGSWNTDVVYDSGTGKATIESGATYTASKASDGQVVTIEMTVSFDGTNTDDDTLDGAKAAIRLGEDGNGDPVFQVYASDEGVAGWVDVAAAGVTPAEETDYSFKFVLDCTNKTYLAYVVVNESDVALTAGNEAGEFAFASNGDTVQSIEFAGAGTVTSITGSYETPVAPEPEEFDTDETIGEVTLTAAQAAWLNGQKNYDILAAKIATMTAKDFNDAYLLNFDITDEFSYEFKVTGIEVGDENVTVTVSLTRTGVILDQAINGTVVLTGTAALGTDFAEIGSAVVADDDFSEGGTTTITLGKGSAKFFQPMIK